MKTVKFCRDCKWVERQGWWRSNLAKHPYCLHTKAKYEKVPDLVTGENEGAAQRFASAARDDAWHLCGIEARWFEPK
jgi:hypothetical protein